MKIGEHIITYRYIKNENVCSYCSHFVLLTLAWNDVLFNIFQDTFCPKSPAVVHDHDTTGELWAWGSEGVYAWEGYKIEVILFK